MSKQFSYLGGHRLGGELIPLLSLLVIQQNHPVSRANSQFAVIWCPGHARHFGSTSILFNQRTTQKGTKKRLQEERPAGQAYLTVFSMCSAQHFQHGLTK